MYKFPNTRASSVRTIMIARRAHGISSDAHNALPSLQHNAADRSHPSHNNLAGGDFHRDQLLIFTKGSWTFTPHQVAIKRMPCSAEGLISQQRAREDDIETRDDSGPNEDDADDDGVDETVELHGHIIGMNLSPDHRLASASVRLDYCN